MSGSHRAALMAAVAVLGFTGDSQAQMMRRGGLFQRTSQAAGVTYYNRGYNYVTPVSYTAQPTTYTYAQPAAPAAPVATAPAQPPAEIPSDPAPEGYAVPDGVKESWVWLKDENVWGYGYQITEGNDKGLWKVRARVAANGAPVAAQQPQEQQTVYGDPTGFIGVLNQIRAQYGLPAVSYDANLSAWASQNNAAQSQYGLGHHVNPGVLQNSGWNYADAASMAAGWMASPGHRATMLAYVTRVGIAYGPGPYWTLNAQ